MPRPPISVKKKQKILELHVGGDLSLRDIAKRVGVSHQTVANVINDNEEEIEILEKTVLTPAIISGLADRQNRIQRLMETLETIEMNRWHVQVDDRGRLLNIKDYLELLREIGNHIGDNNPVKHEHDHRHILGFVNLDAEGLWEVKKPGEVLEGEYTDGTEKTEEEE